MSRQLEEPLTPASRLFLEPDINLVVLSCVGTHQPLRIDAIKAVIADSMLAKHPRLSSILVVDKNGHKFWRKTEIDMDRHVITHDGPVDGAKDDEDAANIYMADLAVSVPFDTDKPLWELHLLPTHKCAVVRAHHALGDGVSLLSFFLAMCRKADDPEKMPTMNPVVVPRFYNVKDGVIGGILWRLVKVVWFTVVFVFDFIARVLWVRDETTVVSGGAGVELWPRKLVTARFLIDDMKVVKKSIPKTTINDVLFGVISFGLSKYIDTRSSKPLREGLRMTGLAMVNLRPYGFKDLEELMRDRSTGWGNKFGMLVLPSYYFCSGSDPLEYLRRAKTMIDHKKSSLESFFSYKIGYLVMSIFGTKYASLLNYRILCNTTFTISNIVGPIEKVTFAEHPVDYIKATSTSLPHAITMHMVSYAGTAYMQILVAKDLIPDPEVLAKCLEDALLEMKDAALAECKRN